MSKQRAKGTAAETAVVRYLQDNGFIHAERRALHGINDKGDITGIPGVVIEVKNHAKLTLAEWVKELQQEMVNANADFGFVVAKKKGTTNPAEWYAVMPLEILLNEIKKDRT
jgi:hypothetical protein